MSATIEPTTLVRTQRRTTKKNPWPVRLLVLTILALLISTGTLWAMGYRPGKGFTSGEEARTVEIEVGDVRVMVIESGTMESSENTMVKCQVEAILGTITANQQAGLTAGGRAGATASSAATTVATQAATVNRSSSASGATGTARGSVSTATASRSVSASAAGGGMAGGGGTNLAKPQIRSFTMTVAPHQPLRPKTPTVLNKGQNGAAAGMAGGGGGGGRGGRGGQGAGMMGGDRQGSTKILSIVPEGSTVTAGEIVCELDSAAFRDELQSQLIRWEQAKSWVEQARQILKVSQIGLLEYKEGILPQDTQVLDKYISYCKTQLNQKKADTKWARDLVAQHLLSDTQHRTYQYSEEQARIVLAEAEGMKRRLKEFTSPRLLRNLEAKIAAVEADLLAQESSFQLEDDRKRKLERMIELCTLRAPKDGLVAYRADSSGPGWNPTAVPMAEGVTVRQGQTIMVLPNSKKMRAKVRVNESKVSYVYRGQKAAVLIEAFPDHPMMGIVTEVTGIPAPANGPVSDVKLYYANVDITSGAFEGLRTGFSAQVAFFVDKKTNVPKIPIESVRWADGQPFAAIPTDEKSGFRWQAIELGLVGAKDAEIVSGLKPGDRVIAAPADLKPAPSATKNVLGIVAAGPADPVDRR